MVIKASISRDVSVDAMAWTLYTSNECRRNMKKPYNPKVDVDY